ncbi:hypothetical protein JYG23_07880 [Sedimentibacter sp. zth1]|uniref:hypothetical protein n=1 Tax=Sedimentibacter sp. zth1 TaxID=2816908 RepID=UPI001A914369|nr:hypothetical protein [Sedimentibacter sp. zth1]QSX07251.1 hypothetical protein JYG23_07880 [Sedimentibacter sp. zth1]
MNIFNKHEFVSYLWKGQLHEATNYLSQIPDKKDLYEKYISIFEKSEYYKRTDNEILGKLDRIYQNYYRNVFWLNTLKEDAEKMLFQELWMYCGSKSDLPKDSYIECEIEKIVKREGYEYLGGDTQGFWGPYIWKSSTKVTYEVELPSGIELYTIIMMDGFISRSWLDFISFGMTGTGGWTGKDGILCCVSNLYDVESNEFNISFLKHEAQHAFDKKIYSDIESVDLEYRAKLVELIYWPNNEKIRDILREADNSNPDNTHSMAAYRIVNELSQKIFECEYVKYEKAWEDKVDKVVRLASDLFETSNKLLNNRMHLM